MPVKNESHPTLIKPPSAPESRAEMENMLELTQLNDIDPDLYTNTRPLWHPPGARGVYGGSVIAQCLVAAQHTVSNEFFVHSMHCYFVMAGDAKIPIIYHVEHVREGRSFAVRTVQARQQGRVIFTTTMSFVKENTAGKQKVEHAYEMPTVPAPIDDDLSLDTARFSQGRNSPFISQQIDIFNNDSPKPFLKRTRQWIKVKDPISDAGGHEAHLAALAYMSDSYFIGTISRVHKLWRIPRQVPREQKEHKDTVESNASAARERKDDIVEDEDVIAALRAAKKEVRPQVGMMVSLDHTIYFHNPRALKSDEWLLTECESPWAGDGRGLVMQKIWTKNGILVASCIQEGVVRLKQEPEGKNKL